VGKRKKNRWFPSFYGGETNASLKQKRGSNSPEKKKARKGDPIKPFFRSSRSSMSNHRIEENFLKKSRFKGNRLKGEEKTNSRTAHVGGR